MSTPQGHDEVPELHERAQMVQGLFVGSGTPPTATSTPAPYEDADQFPLTKNVNATQLQDELAAALERAVLISISDITDGQLITEDNPAVLWVSPSGLDNGTIQTVIANHSAYAAYDIPKEDLAYTAVVQKVFTDKTADLDSDEVQTAIRGLLLKVEAPSSATVTSSFPDGTPSS